MVLAWRLPAVQFDPQMMRCDGACVNETEFRMWRVSKRLSPSSRAGAMKGFSGFSPSASDGARIFRDIFQHIFRMRMSPSHPRASDETFVACRVAKTNCHFIDDRGRSLDLPQAADELAERPSGLFIPPLTGGERNASEMRPLSC